MQGYSQQQGFQRNNQQNNQQNSQQYNQQYNQQKVNRSQSPDDRVTQNFK